MATGERTQAEGQPTRDEVYERVAQEFLRKFSLERDEGFAAAVARRFKETPAKVCCRAIGHWIDKNLLRFGWTQIDLADRIGVDRSAVAKWTAGGAISLGHLVLVLLEFRSDFAELPLPAREELALEGYLAALSYVRAKIDPAGGFEPLDRERFWCLFHLFSEPFWEQAIRKKDRELVKKEVDRVRRRAGESLGFQPRRVVQTEDLRSPRPGVGGRLGTLSRTPTGRVVDPMTTKLEMMVGYLAGRQGKAAESIRRELDDPTSEASRWLDAMQRAIPGDPSTRARRTDDDLISLASMRDGITTRGRRGNGCCRFSRACRPPRPSSSLWELPGEDSRRTGFTASRPLLARARRSMGSAPRPAQGDSDRDRMWLLRATRRFSKPPSLLRKEPRLRPIGPRDWHWPGSKQGSANSESDSEKSDRRPSPSDPRIDELRSDVETAPKGGGCQSPVQQAGEPGNGPGHSGSPATREATGDPDLDRRSHAGACAGLAPGTRSSVAVKGRECNQVPNNSQGKVRCRTTIPSTLLLARAVADGRLQGHSGGFSGSRMQRPGGPG